MRSIRDLVRVERQAAMAQEFAKARARIPYENALFRWPMSPAPFGEYQNHLQLRDVHDRARLQSICNCFGCTGEPVLTPYTWKRGERSLLLVRGA